MKLRDEKCQRCGWRYPGFHICVDLSTPEPKVKVKKVRKKREPVSTGRKQTPEWKANVQAGIAAHLEERREKNRPRDEEIVRRYSEDERTQRELAVEFKLDPRTIQGILHRARDEGKVTIRPAKRRKKV